MNTIKLQFASVALAVAGWLVATAGVIVGIAEPAAVPGSAGSVKLGGAAGESAARQTRDWYPFRGEVATVDPAGGTLGLKKQSGERVVRIIPTSELMRDGRTIQLADVKIGEYIHGKLHKQEAGQEVVVSAALDPEPPAKKSPKSPKKTARSSEKSATEDSGKHQP